MKEPDRVAGAERAALAGPQGAVAGWLSALPTLLHVKGGWDAKNAARPKADAPRYRSDLKRPGSACGILIEQERSKWQCWVAGAWLSLRWSIPELLNRVDQPAVQATASPRRSLLSGVSAQAILRDFPQSTFSKGAPSRVQADAPFLSFVPGGSAAALLPKSESLLLGWRFVECSYEDAFGTDPESGAEDLGACRSPTLVAQM